MNPSSDLVRLNEDCSVLIGRSFCFAKCGNIRSNLLFRVFNPRKNQYEMFAASTCSCQINDFVSKDQTWFDESMMIELIGLFSSGKTNRELSETMANKFDRPDVLGGPRPGKYEWRSPCTQKIENMRSAMISDAWSSLFEGQPIPSHEIISRCAASSFTNRISRKPDVWKGFGRDAKYQELRKSSSSNSQIDLSSFEQSKDPREQSTNGSEQTNK